MEAIYIILGGLIVIGGILVGYFKYQERHVYRQTK